MKSEFRLRTRSGFVLMLAIVLLTALIQTGMAQEVTASIAGKVTDPSGASIANAAVTAKDMDRGVIYTTKTNEEGLYVVPRVPPGRYQLFIEAQGFKKANKGDMVLELNQHARVDLVLEIGAVTESVEVVGTAPLLKTDTTEIGSVMQANSISSLPLETRNYNQLALLTPGAVTTSPASFNSGRSTFNSGRPYLNGNREQANYYLLDGMDNNEFVDNNVAYSPSVDAIQEFNIITNNPSAEFGQFLGGVISVSLKSGTNQVHGNGFYSVRNDFFNANEWARNFSHDPTINSTPASLSWNVFGGTFGGPIKKDKLFFFADYQGSRFDTPSTSSTLATLTPQELTGNFSDTPGIALHYPGTTVPIPGNDLSKAAICGAGQTFGVSACIPGLNKVALGVIGSPLFPKSTLTGLQNNATNITGNSTHGNQGDLKLDWSATDKDKFFARYSQQHVEAPITNSQPLLYNGSGNGVFPLWNGVLGYTKTITSSLVNDLRFGVNYYPAEDQVQNPGSSNAGTLIPGEPTSFLPGLAFVGGAMGGGINGPFALGTIANEEIFHQTAIQFDDTAILVRGRHTLRFGFQAIRYRNDFVPSASADGSAGQIAFTGQYSGYSEADFLLGLPGFMGLGSAGSGTVGQRSNTFGAFVQDDFRVNSHLTLNLGLRWQLFTPIYEVHDRMTNFTEVGGQVQLAGQNGNSRALYNQYNGIANFLPRVGLAWTPWNSNTVIRAAFSRSSFQEGTGEFNRLTNNPPWTTDSAVTFQAGPNGAIPANQLTLNQGFNGLTAAAGGTPCTAQTVASAPASCFAGIKLHMTDPNYRPAVTNQWNISIQHQFGNATTFQAAYVGQHADHLADILFANQKVVQPNGAAPIPGPFLSGNPAIKTAVGQARLNETTAVHNYDALQLTMQRRLATGLSFQVNYSWAKCLTNNQGYYARFGDLAPSQTSGDRNFQQNVYNINQDYGPCDSDVRSLFNGYVTYELPFGHNRMFGKTMGRAANAIVGDWQVSTIFTVHGGFPISIFDFSGIEGTGSAEPRPDCLGPAVQTPYQQNPNGEGYVWFSGSNMAHPQANHLGTCGIGSNRGPGLKQLDVSFSKTVRITERQSVEFQAEAINAFNTPIFTFSAFSSDIFASPTLGVINTSAGARNLQFGVKYKF